jgi:hypothetical protein
MIIDGNPNCKVRWEAIRWVGKVCALAFLAFGKVCDESALAFLVLRERCLTVKA